MDLDEARAVLGVGDQADPDALRSAYRKAQRAAHPDLGGVAADAARVNEAFALLSAARPATLATAPTRAAVVHPPAPGPLRFTAVGPRLALVGVVAGGAGLSWVAGDRWLIALVAACLVAAGVGALAWKASVFTVLVRPVGVALVGGLALALPPISSSGAITLVSCAAVLVAVVLCAMTIILPRRNVPLRTKARWVGQGPEPHDFLARFAYAPGWAGMVLPGPWPLVLMKGDRAVLIRTLSPAVAGEQLSFSDQSVLMRHVPGSRAVPVPEAVMAGFAAPEVKGWSVHVALFVPGLAYGAAQAGVVPVVGEAELVEWLDTFEDRPLDRSSVLSLHHELTRGF